MRIFGIRIGASPSWFLVLGLMIYFLAAQFSNQLEGYSDTTTFAVAVGGAFCFFVSLVLHELGHALVARRLGIGIIGIDLWLLGGLAKLDRDSRSPGEEFKVAVAGPAVTLAIVVVAIGAAFGVDNVDEFTDSALLGSDQTTPVSALLGWLGLVNIALFLFNMIPAFPLDGGRIARAAAWRITGERTRGTRIAGQIGVGFSYVIGAAGIAIALTGDAFDGVWLMLLAWFINQGARSAVVSSEFSERIGDVTAADLMDTEPVWIPGHTKAVDAAEEYFERYGARWLPLVDEHTGRYLGALRAERIDGAVAAGQPALEVDELVEEDGSDELRVDGETSLEELLASPALRLHGSIAVVDPQRRLVGVVTADRVRRALTASAVGR